MSVIISVLAFVLSVVVYTWSLQFDCDPIGKAHYIWMRFAFHLKCVLKDIYIWSVSDHIAKTWHFAVLTSLDNSFICYLKNI